MTNEEQVEILEEIRKANGGVLRPKDVVDAARPANHPLHSKFEWDDGEAAERYREWQARRLIKVTVIDYTPANSSVAITVPAFVSLLGDRKTNGGGYRATVECASDETLREEMIESAARDLEKIQRRYQQYAEIGKAIKLALNCLKKRRKAQ